MKTLATLTLILSLNLFAAESRIKDLVSVKGVRSNPVIGYGLVIGLNGSGDGGGEILEKSMKRMFQKLGLSSKTEIASKNVASVIVTAKLPAFPRLGQKIDVTVSSIGDASSLAGGTLLVTPLKGGNGKVYALATGAISIGGLKAGSKFPTTGRIISGATVEKEIPFKFDHKKSLRFSLNNPDFTTAARIQKVINQQLGGKYAIARDSATIDLIIPMHYKRNVVKLMAIIENFKVNSDVKSKVVINERTGTLVMGGNIFLKPVAISHGDLTIQIGEQNDQKKGSAKHIYYTPKQSTLKDLVKSLNTLGASPEDLISIFQALKKNGSLIAEIETI